MIRKEPIRLREKALKNGNRSLYLDIYSNGKRRYEFLGLYLVAENTRFDKERNKTTMLQAELELSRRVIQMQQNSHGVIPDSYFNKISLCKYVGMIWERKEGLSYHTRYSYKVLMDSLKEYGDTELQSVSANYIRGFLRFLESKSGKARNSKTKASTRKMRYESLTCVLNNAVRDGLIQSNPTRLLERSEKPSLPTKSNREYLTMDEIRKLSSTESKFGGVRDAFLFACFTGLRFSDIRGLKWSEIRNGRIMKMQQKTKNFVEIPLNENAMRYLPKKDGEYVFNITRYVAVANYDLKRLAEMSGIDKNLSFHVSRHTFATLLLTYGTDIYTVSKLMGHTDISTTQIYAKVVDEKKAKAVNLIPSI